MNKIDPNVTLIVLVLLFIILFFGKIAINGIEYSEYKDNFKIKCENNGGVMFIPKGVKGWPAPECRDPDAMVEIDM